MQVYYGWFIVAMAAWIYVLIVGTTFGSFGLYVLPVSKEFGLSRAEMNTGVILLSLGNAVLAPLLGRFLDRFPARPVMLACAFIAGGAFVTLGMSRSLWLDAAVLVLAIPAVYLGAGSLTSTVLIARWFKANRGRAMALAGMGILVSNMIIPPAVSALIEADGWRRALLITGVALTALLLPTALVARDRPRAGDVEPGATATDAVVGEPAPLASIVRSAPFWTIALSTSITLGVTQAVILSLAPLARESGLSAPQTSTVLSALGVGGFIGTALLAIVADRVDRIILLSSLIVLIGALNAVLLLDHSYALLLAVAVALGAATGVVTPTFYALLADRFGAASFGTVRGLTFPILAAWGMIGMRYAGEAYDRSGYDLMFQGFIAALAVAAPMMLCNKLGSRKAAKPRPA
jgi:predicted MFS family arabinose efflux permease